MAEKLDQAKEVMAALVRSDISPENAADWAMGHIGDDSEDWSQDPKVWTALDRLGGADLQVDHGVYLHSEEDFQAWLSDLER